MQKLFARSFCRSLIAFFVVVPLMAASASEKAKKEPKDGVPVPVAKLADAHVVGAWTRAAQVGETTHVFLTVENKGPAQIFLKGGETDVAFAVQLVKFERLGAIQMSTLVDPVPVDPNSYFVFEPGVVALELRKLKKELNKGDVLPITVVFSDIGEVQVDVEVDSRTAVRYPDPPPDAIPPAGAKKSGH